jgi:hypothetical protein
MKERRGEPGRISAVDASKLDEETRWKYFLIWAVTYNISLRALADRTFLSYALALKGFTIPGRNEIMQTLENWAADLHDTLKDRLKKDAVTCYVEADTTTQRGQKHVLASIVHYFDQAKKKMRQWCFDVGEFVGESLTTEVIYHYLSTAVYNVGFLLSGFTSDSARVLFGCRYVVYGTPYASEGLAFRETEVPQVASVVDSVHFASVLADSRRGADFR